MHPRLRLSALAVVFAGTLAGCGGSGGHHYTLASTEACFKSHGYRALVDANRALPGSAGNLLVSLSKPGYEDVFIVFGKDGKEALTIENRAVALAEKSFAAHHEVLPRSQVLAGVAISGNVFFYSDTGAISVEARSKVSGCLR